ncbi:auxin-responsive protein SAUR50-like [Punica granatum]|uniref:Uncharacterized protein n=2 Tax=Punica granatum TaxID=22663 RepID=A0A218W9F1_PUNGR|nr:auxin-responsive protein SAUR50-like [Punica granatum]OWM69484.1 hypothetical protein CDL15_Pgr013945 [Punica granatum]PKI38200.1 hypothetical protein CRG98_041453 [Punica granatum]
MDPKKSNKITDVVRLQRILKKWKKLAVSPKNSNPTTTNCNKSIKFLKRTLSFSDNNDPVPKGYLAVCVGKELKRYVIPMAHLSHQAFGILLQEAEEEFGFEQEGVLKIPCEVALFEKILEAVEDKRSEFDFFSSGQFGYGCNGTGEETRGWCRSPDCDLTSSPCDRSPLCR